METNDSIYFYGINDKYGFMSNFFPCKFRDNDGHVFCNSEQYFMYHKCLTFDSDNKDLLKKILSSKSATSIKNYGRQVKNFDDEIWKNKRYNIMLNGLMLKFGQNTDLKNKLLETNNKTLYEASKYDKIWGIGFYAKDAINCDKKLYGQNLLGKCLMEIRSNLK